MDGFARLLFELQKLSPSVRGQCAVEWGSSFEGFRTHIRQSLARNLSPLEPADLATFANLDHVPHPSGWSVSISHTRDLGGWMAVEREVQIGWDVEIKDRIKLSVIERVCNAEEVRAAPEPAYLWCAKEAFFKALEDFQPVTIPELTIAEWRSRGQDLWIWTGLGPRNGLGVLLQSGAWLLAGCLIVL